MFQRRRPAAFRDVVLVADDDATCLEWVVGVLEDAYRVVPTEDGPFLPVICNERVRLLRIQ